MQVTNDSNVLASFFSADQGPWHCLINLSFETLRWWKTKRNQSWRGQVKVFSLTIIQVHLVQLLWFLFDADSDRRAAPVLLEAVPFALWHLRVLLTSWARAAADLWGCRHAESRGERSVGRGGGLRGWRGGRGGAAGWVEARRLEAPGGLLNDGDMWDWGRLDRWDRREALGERGWWQVVQFGAGAWRGWGGERWRLSCQSLLADGVSPTHHTGSGVRGHYRGHDLRGKVWLWEQGQAGGVLATHKRGVKVIMWLRLYGRDCRRRKKKKDEERRRH